MSAIRRHLGGWLIMLPGLILLAFFVWVPLISNLTLSLHEAQGYTKGRFVGVEKYVEVLADPIFHRAFLNTAQYVAWSIVIGFLLPVLLAWALSELLHLRGALKVALYFPNMVPGLAAVIMWKFLFDPNPGGMLNSLLAGVGVGPLPWLDHSFWVIPLIVLTMTWKGAGATTLIYLAAIQSVSATYYEVARMEGATVLQRLRYVTLPSVAPTMRMLFVLQVISVFQVFYEPLVMTGGGPDNASLSLLQLIYRYAFIRGDVAKAAALGVIMAAALFLLTACYWLLNRKVDAR